MYLYRFFIVDKPITVAISGPPWNGVFEFLYPVTGYIVGQTIRVKGRSGTFYNATIDIVGSTQLFVSGSALQTIQNDLPITVTNNSKEVNPLNHIEVKYKYQREEGEMFFRTHMDGELVFVNNKKSNDFSFFSAIESNPSTNCQENYIQVERSCDNGKTWSVFWNGYFGTNDGKWDLDNCKFTITPKVDDKYRCLLDNKNLDVNILLTPNNDVIFDTNVATYEYIECLEEDIEVDFGSLPAGWSFVDSELCEPLNNGYLYHAEGNGNHPFENGDPAPIFCTLVNAATWQVHTLHYFSADDGFFTDTVSGFIKYIREYKYTPYTGGTPVPPPGTGWVQTDSGINVGGQFVDKWARTPSDGAFTTYFYELVPEDCRMICTLVMPSTSETLTRAHKLSDTAQLFLDQICGSMGGVVSDFFEINPVGDTPGYVAGRNYVDINNCSGGGAYTYNPVGNLYFEDTGDFITPGGDPATVNLMSFATFMDQLKFMFNVFWFVTDDLKLRIEHYSYFDSCVGIDLTDAQYHRYIAGTNKYEYLKPAMPQYETFEFMQAKGQDFIGVPISYNNACINFGKTFLRKASLSNTDVPYLLSGASTIKNEGIVWLATKQVGSDFVTINEQGKLSGDTILNGHLSWANLHYNYHRWGRVILSGSMNNIAETFCSAIRTQKQVPIKFPFCCGDEAVFSLEPRPSRLLRTDLTVCEPGGSCLSGEKCNGGEVLSAEYAVKDSLLTVELVYLHP